MAYPEGKVVYHLSPSFLSVKWENYWPPSQGKACICCFHSPWRRFSHSNDFAVKWPLPGEGWLLWLLAGLWFKVTGCVFQQTQWTQPVTIIPRKACFLFSASIDLDRSLLKPFHQGSEHRQAGRGGRCSGTFPRSGVLLGFRRLTHYWGPTLSKAWCWFAPQGVGVTWPSKSSLCQDPSSGSPSTSVLLPSTQTVSTAP